MNNLILFYNFYNDAVYWFNAFYGYSTPLDNAIQVINTKINNDLRYSYYQKEYLKSLASFAKYV